MPEDQEAGGPPPVETQTTEPDLGKTLKIKVDNANAAAETKKFENAALGIPQPTPLHEETDEQRRTGFLKGVKQFFGYTDPEPDKDKAA